MDPQATPEKIHMEKFPNERGIAGNGSMRKPQSPKFSEYDIKNSDL